MLKVGDNIPNINVTTHKGETINLAILKERKLSFSFIQEQIPQVVLHKVVI